MTAENKKISIAKKGDDRNDLDYYLQLSALERLELVEKLRQKYIDLFYETEPGFQRVYRIINDKKSTQVIHQIF